MNEDEIYRKNTEWYKKVYNQLIESRKSRGLDKSKLDGYYEKHHIIPKCMGGKNEDSNYVLLTYREHILAHMILHRIYPNVNQVLGLFAILISKNKNLKRDKSMSSRYLSSLKEAYIKAKDELARKQIGKSVPPEVREKLRKASLNRKISEDTKKKLYNTRFRIKIQDSSGNIYNSIKECSKELNIPETTLKYWIKNSMNGFKKLNSSERESFSLKVQGPDGTIYNSIKECSKVLGKCDKTIRNWINKHPELGYKLVQ